MTMTSCYNWFCKERPEQQVRFPCAANSAFFVCVALCNICGTFMLSIYCAVTAVIGAVLIYLSARRPHRPPIPCDFWGNIFLNILLRGQGNVGCVKPRTVEVIQPWQLILSHLRRWSVRLPAHVRERCNLKSRKSDKCLTYMRAMAGMFAALLFLPVPCSLVMCKVPRVFSHTWPVC